MPGKTLYTDLSGYYDLMCADIDYRAQSNCIQRLQRLFGNGGNRHLDLACGTGPHVRHFIDAGYRSGGLDINQPMLDIAAARCPEARFSRQDMCDFRVDEPQDLITCFLYSLHYTGSIERLAACIASVHDALAEGGLFCFNAVDKDKIDNALFVVRSAPHPDGLLHFRSAWYYSGRGERQSLQVRIARTVEEQTQIWHDEHPMVAVDFATLQSLLRPYFEVHMLEHDYERIVPWREGSGNAVFACVKV